MQYLKHVVENDVLFTKVISKFEPVTLIQPLSENCSIEILKKNRLAGEIKFKLDPSISQNPGGICAHKYSSFGMQKLRKLVF